MRLVLLSLLLLLGGCQRSQPKVIVFGVDGCDPVLLERFIAEGKLPNFARLAHRTRLATTDPPQSPVAWSTFVTGLDPDQHGIHDFLHRGPDGQPKPSLTSVKDGQYQLERKGRPFWQELSKQVPVTVVKTPADFPPEPGGRVLAGMGVPDLEGSYGTFSFYSTGPRRELEGGRFVPVEVRDGQVHASVVGPAGDSVPFQVVLDGQSALIKTQDQEELLKVGQWSDWVPLGFTRVDGMVRFYLQATEPEFKLYVSPLNADPARPSLPIATPEDFARHLYHRCGRFYTQGMPDDTKALTSGVFNDDEFLAQSQLVYDERKRLLAQSLEEYKTGLLFFYTPQVDIISHLYWRAGDPQHPGYKLQAPGHTQAIEQAYQQADELLGMMLARADANTLVLVVSDHGFAPFYRSFDLNVWLTKNGYADKAQAVGFNGLYLKHPDPALLDELSQQLLAVRDGDQAVIHRVLRPTSGPDLLIGYERGYRASWQTALGKAGDQILSDNLDHWSGDHLIDAELVPGVLLCNQPILVSDPHLRDLPPTILAHFGRSSHLPGRVLR